MLDVCSDCNFKWLSSNFKHFICPSCNLSCVVIVLFFFFAINVVYNFCCKDFKFLLCHNCCFLFYPTLFSLSLFEFSFLITLTPSKACFHFKVTIAQDSNNKSTTVEVKILYGFWSKEMVKIFPSHSAFALNLQMSHFEGINLSSW